MRTIGEQKRTCSYCLRYFSTKEKFNKHFKKCSARHQKMLDKQNSMDTIIESYDLWGEGWYVEDWMEGEY